MAVKPWIGAVKEPDNHPDPNPEAPDCVYNLEYAYGYRCQDSRQNVYYSCDDEICYMTACLGVMLNKDSNTQKFFGGGEADSASKQTSSSKESHNNDIMCMDVNTSGGRNRAVTGQVGKWPAVFVWDTTTGEKVQRFALDKQSRAVAAVAISPDGTHIATVDKHNDHYFCLWNCGDNSSPVFKDKSGPDPSMDLCFSKQPGSYAAWSVGPKGGLFWDNSDKKKLAFGKFDRIGFACCTSDDQGNMYAGAANSLIYVYGGNQPRKAIGFTGKGFIGAINWVEGKLYAGSRSGMVSVIDSASMECLENIDFGMLPRAIDAKDGNLIVGLRNGSIVQCNLESKEQTTYMQSHNDGEVWGLALDDAFVYTSGDDNQVKKWDPFSRTCVETAIVNEASRTAKKNRASTLGKHPDSQSARGLAISCNGHLAVCANDGSVTIRELGDFGTTIKELHDSAEWIEVAEYSPDGSMLAVGSHDTNIYLYDANNDYALLGKCTKHNATITCIDWSMDGSYIRSVCNAYELLFFNMPDCAQDPSGASNTTGTDWATGHCKFGWCVDGIFPSGTDGTHINGVDLSEDQTTICVGDDYGLVTLFRNPCRKGHQPKSLRGHSEHVVRVKFGRGGLNGYIFSVGGYDQTMLQWKLQ